jgi:hypothetical protein
MHLGSITQLELLKYLAIPKPSLKKYKGEKRLHLEVVQHLLGLSVDGKLRAIWFHPANEAIQSKERGIGFNILLKMMGKIPGVPDLVFGWKNGIGFIELKCKSPLTESQINFAKWCTKFEIPFIVCKSWEEVQVTLKEWGILYHGNDTDLMRDLGIPLDQFFCFRKYP